MTSTNKPSAWNSPPWRLRREVLMAAMAGAGLIALSGSVMAEPVETLAIRLSKLRGEVETLSNQLSNLTSESRDELRARARQKSNLELDLEKEVMRQRKLRHALSEKQKTVVASRTRDDALRPLFDRNLEVVRAYVQKGLPFRRAERLQALDKLKNQVATAVLNAPRGVSRLWSFVEDELRITRDSGLYRQTIEVEGVEQLADVIRIGSVMMLFKANDDSLGFAVRRGAGYLFQPVRDTQARKQLMEIFTSFKKQIRLGYFQIPNALLAELPASPGGAK